MKSILTAIISLAGALAWAQERPAVTTPTGNYRAEWFALEGTGEPTPVFVAWRDGKPVQFWSTRPKLPGIGKTEGALKLLTDGLAGDADKVTVELRLVSIWAPIRRLALQSLTLDVAAGGWTLTTDGKEAGTGKLIKGAAVDAPIAAGQDWPSFYGVMTGCAGATCGKPIVADLAQAKPLWRSEAVSLSGWGSGVDGRYPDRAAFGTLCGGASSPIVADGIVYLYHYRPAGDVTPEGKEAEQVAKFKDHPAEQEAMRRFYSKTADVVVTAIDGATGKTLWQSVWPQKQGNFQTHKWRGANPTPAVGGGVLVVADYSWGLHAYDAKTGELKWTRGGGKTINGNSAPVGPVISGSVVVFQNFGLDLQTGRELWKVPNEGSPRRMTIAGKERVLLVGWQASSLVDPVAGKVLWTSDVVVKDKLNTVAMPVCEGDKMVAYTATYDKETGKVVDGQAGKVVAYTVSESGIERAWESEPCTWDENLFMAVAKGRVYAAHKNEGLRCLDLATGKTVGSVPELKCGSNASLIIVDDRVFYQPEGQHGGQQIHLVDAVSLKALGGAFSPPHSVTTAYGQMPLANVVVDGRLIIRGMDGVYGYDVRALSK